MGNWEWEKGYYRKFSFVLLVRLGRARGMQDMHCDFPSPVKLRKLAQLKARCAMNLLEAPYRTGTTGAGTARLESCTQRNEGEGSSDWADKRWIMTSIVDAVIGQGASVFSNREL